MRSLLNIIIAVLFLVSTQATNVFGQAASSNYATQTGTLGATYSWIDCSGGTSIVSGDDSEASFSWPFTFSFYDNTYTTANSIGVATNGFIRLDGTASTDYSTASNYSLSSGSTELGQIIATSVFDCSVGGIGSSWVRYLVTGSAPNRILTIEYNDIEIDYNDNVYADVQVSFYETSNKVVLKLGADNITAAGVDMGIHSGISGYFNKWQEVASGTNNAWMEFTPTTTPTPPSGPAASWNYGIQTGTTGTTYSWIDCSSGSSIVSGDDSQASINWPFNFSFYDNAYTTSNSLSVATNGFIRLDGTATTNYNTATSYVLTSTATNLGQIIAMAVYDGKVGDNGGWVRSLVTGTAPNRVFTIEYNNLEIAYSDNKYADVQVSFYESSNKIVLKLGTENLNKSGVDMGLHSGVNGFFNLWKEVNSGTNNTWIEYTPPNIEVNATVGTSLTYYPTLKDAFDKINDGTHRGNITIKIKSSTTESSSAILNASGTGSSNYSLVNIYPTVTGLSINGNLAAPLIDLNGADNVTIDGRVNGSGSTRDLIIVNSSTAGTAATSTIRFINGATNNTVKYCTIKGSETQAASGVLFFSDTNAGSGNNTNTIDNNNITNTTNVNRPVNAIYSLGTAGKENSGNIVSNNAIYDFLKHGTSSNGIFLSSNTTSWTISANSFYETTSFVPTAVVTYNAIFINNTAGSNFSISNNYIGGKAALCGGTAWTKTNASNNIFNAINLNVGSATASSVQNNTIKNFSWSNSSNASWSAIAITSGNVNIGTITGNTIGAATGTGSVIVTGATNGLNVYGINITSTGTIDCRNNTIGSITAQNGAAFSSNIFGISKSATAGTTTISNNFIGSTSTANSLLSNSISSSNPQTVNGISSSGTGIIVISNNSISNIKNSAISLSSSPTYGIITSAGSNTIQNNTVYNISTASSTPGSGISASAIGIVQNSTTPATTQTVKGNVVYNINNTHASAKVVVNGIYYAGPSTGTNTITENFIHSLSISSTNILSEIHGIALYNGLTTCANNIINLGVGISTGYKINGIWDNSVSTNNNNIYFNTIYIAGTASGTTSNTAALWNDANTSARNYRNNILFNARSGGTSGKHFAIYYAATGGTFTSNYNDYYAPGTGGIIAYYGGDKNTLALLQSATGQDVNSLAINPNFTTPGGTIFSDYYAVSTLAGVSGTGILTDYEEITRNTTPKMGALESSLGFVWQGNTSTDFANASNWLNGAVPLNGSEITFAASPTNDCYLDQNRSLKNITNTSSKKFVVNGKQLTLTGGILSATANQIDASGASSVIVFGGTVAQSIPAGTFVSNTINGLTVNNSAGLTQNGAITIQNVLTLTNGAFKIGANTLTVNGLVSSTAGTLTGGSTSNLVIGGSGASTTLPNVTVNNFTLNRLNGINLGGDLTIAGTLALTSGTLVVDSNTLKITKNAPTRTNGNIDASNTNATISFSTLGGITLPTSLFLTDINNLTINGGGITVVENITVNGILDLQTSNPSATKGLLDMTLPNELIMGADAINEGGGDVTGIITRYTILDSHTYTFGNKNTWLTFYSGATSLPDYMKLKVVIGNEPWGAIGTVKRVYELIQANGNNYLATFRAFYLDSELNGNAENILSFWAATSPFTTPVDNARSNSNSTENWVEISDFDLDYLPSTFGVNQISMDESTLSYQTWTGIESDDWNDSRNWEEALFPGTIPTPASFVVIPDAATTPNDPTLPPNAITEIKTISLKPGSILNSGSSDNAQLSLNHNIGTWNNDGGTFNPGNSTVNFIYNGNTTISGTTTFNNIFISENTAVNMTASSYIKVTGGITINEVGLISGEFRTKESGATTVEYNGANQTITNPVNAGGNSGYYKLILSGSGIKTMPATAMSIADEFVLTGPVTATAQSVLTVGSELEILSGATFATGAFDHFVGGHFDVGGHLSTAGTFIPSPGTTITLNGTVVQNIYGGSGISFENLVVDNITGVDIFTDVAVNDVLTLTNGNLNVGTTTLTINGGLAKTSGFINVNTASSLTFGGTTALTLPASLFFTPPSVNNLTINRTGGVIAGSDLTVNGILNLQSANPSAIIGSFDTGNNTLFMGANATTTGIGDLTGIVRREHTFNTNTEYTFGSQYTTFSFTDGNLKPTWISLKISIGSVPSWNPWSPSPVGKIKRLYQVASSANSSVSQATINMRYLLSELDATDNDASKLVFWHKFISFASGVPHEHGKSSQDFTNHTIGVTGLPLGSVTTTNPDDSQVAIAYSLSPKNTWKGGFFGQETQWEQAQNWTAGHVPLSTDDVLIPGGLTYYPSLTASANAVAKTLEIATGASITANSYNITIYGFGGAWINQGTFTPGTGKVLFNHGVPSETVTISGITNFYNIEVGPNTTFQPVAGNILRIAGVGSADPGGTSVIDFSSINNTVEWNGTVDQTIVDPNGIGGNGGYFNLVLSGSGTKTMQNSVIHIAGDFSTSGSITAIASNSIKVDNNMTIGVGSSFVAGNFSHELAGNFENNGTFTSTSGGTITFNGTSAQTISGTSTTDFNNLTINNLLNVNQTVDVNVNNVLRLNGGNLIVGNTTLGINGTISNPSGAIDVSAVSNLSFGGTTAITLNNNLFIGNPTINNLIINRSGGVTLGNQSLAINGNLALTAGTFTIGANTLTLAGNSLTRVNGNINAGNINATLVFTNTLAITLPAGVITGNINNLTINGAGINAGSDLTLNGILNLMSANQSATVGSLNMGAFTLNMGAAATTTGTGDVTGIVRRQHTFTNGVEYTFGNQYTSLNFLNVSGSTKPTWVSCKIEIGTAPTWRSEAINRYYSFAQSGGNDRMIVKLHYLDSELHGTETDETKLVFWDAYDPALTPNNFVLTYPRNHNGTDATNNWIQLTGPAINYLATSSTLDVKQWGLSYTNVTIHKWIGLGSVSYPGDWSLPGHWEGGVPNEGDNVLIPTTLPSGNSGYPYRNLLPVISPAKAQSVEIESGAVLNSNGYNITISGSGDAWINNGTFTPGSGTVIFNHGDVNEAVILNGTTSFNNLAVGNKTFLQAASGSTTIIGGTFNAVIDSKLDFISNANSVEYNGTAAQNVANQSAEPTAGYYHLILSGSGSKILTADELKIYGNLTTNAIVSAIGNTLTMNGSVAQSITGTVTPTLNNLSISNITSPVTSSVNLTCSGIFTNSGEFDMTSAALAVAGTVANSGTVKTASVSINPLPSGKTWGGTVQYYNNSGNQTAVGGTFNNLTFSNTSGTQTAAGNLTVNGTLTTTIGGLLNMASYQLLGTLSTISNGGTIQTQNISTVPIPAGKTWNGTIQYNALSGGQTVINGTYNVLTLSNTSGTQTAGGDIAATTFNTVAGGTLNMGTNVLSLTNISHSGILRTQNTSATPFTAGLTWGGTVLFDGTAGQTLPSSTYNNLTIGNTAGVTSTANQTVNGILNLSVANPDATHGSLDMTTYTLYLGGNSNTIGTGDVTGIITRNSFLANKIYTYGNANQYVFFPSTPGQTLPSEASVRVSLLSTPPDWVTNGTLRLYEIAQTGSVGTKALFRTNYLDSELAGGVDESLLSIWSRAGHFLITDEGWADYNSSENWLTLSDVNFQLLPPDLGDFEVTLAPTSQEFKTWNGSQGTTDWNTASNWTPNGVPTSILGIVIPIVSSSNNFSPDLPDDAEGKYIIIQNGGIVNTLTDAELTLSGNGNVWSSESGAVFNPGNSNVIFNGNISGGAASIAGNTDFYDITIAANTTLRPGLDSYIRIANAITNNGVLDAAATHNIIEFKKNGDLSIQNPNGNTPGYHTLILSGTGIKTLPASLDIWHDFINNGTVDAGTGVVKINGNYSLQNIGGTSISNFYDLEIDNTSGIITTSANITAGNSLSVIAGATLQPGATNTIGGTGTLTGSGTVIVTGLGAINSFCTQYPGLTKDLTNLTVDYNGAGNQTVCAANYGNLLISPNGTRTVTLANSGIIGVSGVFDPDKTLTDYIVTGSTMHSNGTGSQTVPAFNYYNVLVSGTRNPGSVVTLVNGGTIGIAGHSTVVPDVNTSYDITNNTIDINGSGDQNIDPFTFWNVRFSGGGTKTTSGDLAVIGSFTVEPGVTLDMSASILSGTFNGGIINNGSIKTANTSATPLPTGKTWGGLIEYTGSGAQTLVQGTYNNLEMSGTGGGTTAADITVNGVLNLNHVNPSPTQGILHTGTYTLNMGESATTTGPGDVTGIVKREHTFTNGIEYSFGNQFTTMNFLGIEGSTKPTWVSCKIEIGTAPVWRTENVKRIYSFLQADGTDRTYVKLHYLDSELNASETDEDRIIMYTDKDGLITGSNTVSIGKSSNDIIDNWVELLGMAINQIATSSTTFAKEYGLGYTNVSKITWTGAGAVLYPGDWSLPGNWLGGVPTATDDVLIPDGLTTAYPYRNQLSAIAPAHLKTLEIEAGATVTATDYDITVSGDANAWVNNGTFVAGTGTVIFNNGSTTNAATISGNTNFYNVTVSDNTKVQPVVGSVTGIGGTLSAGAGSILDFSSNDNTINYNGNDSQTILNSNGTIPGYFNLTLSSSGTKTFPASIVNILGDITINANVITYGNTISMSGSSLQTISGGNATEFNNLTIDNTDGVLLNMDQLTRILGTLQINAGKKMEISADDKLTVTGSIINNGGIEGLTLLSNSSGSASLLHNTNGVAAKVERYIGGAAENWHFLSSPVSNQSIAGDWLPSGTYGNGTGYDLYVWDEPTPCWVYQLNTTVAPTWPAVHPSANFVHGRGYLYSVQAVNTTKEFAGNLNNGDVSYGLTADGSSDINLQGFNLVGNPYPSSIDWKESKGWTRDNLMSTGGGNDMWIWNPEAGNYGVYNSADASGVGTNAVTRYIPSMQGFFVRAQSTGNLETTNDVRVHDATTLWKSGQIETNRFIAVVYSETDQTFDEVRLLFGYPVNKAGAAKLFSPVLTAPSLYLPEGKANFTIRYLTDTIANPHVPLMFKAGYDGYYTINFDFDNYDFDIAILEDRLTGGFTDLTIESNYRFRASNKDNENRFIIHFGAIPAKANMELPANIYASGGELVIDLTLVDDPTDVKVVDVLGRTILQKSMGGNTIHRLPLNAKSQVFIVFARSKNAWVSKKVFVH